MRVDDTIDVGGNNTLKDAVGRNITVFNKNCVVCGESFKAKSKTHKKCYACRHIKIVDAEETQQVAYQQGRFGVAEIDELYEPEEDEVFDEEEFEAETGHSLQEIYDMFSEDEEDYEEDY